MLHHAPYPNNHMQLDESLQLRENIHSGSRELVMLLSSSVTGEPVRSTGSPFLPY